MKIRRSLVAFVLAVVMAGTVFAGSVGAAVAAESRTAQAQSSVISIRTPQELAVMTSGPESVGRTYILENDIPLTQAWTPIVDFRGTFDGQGHTVNNLFVLPNSDEFGRAGVFASVGNTAVIKNVTINIGAQGIVGASNAGALIAVAPASGERVSVKNVRVTGNITSTGVAAGGLVGQGGVNFSNVHYYGNVLGDRLAGGLIGAFDSSNTFAGRIERSSAIGTVTAASSSGRAGGLAGHVSSRGPFTISDSYTTGTITLGSSGVSGSGGFAGGLFGLGSSRDTIVNSYSTMDIIAETTYAAQIGGLIGAAHLPSLVNSFRLDSQNIEHSGGNPINSIGTPLTEEQMRNQESFTGWDFDEVWEFRSGENNGFPVLQMRRGDTPIPTPSPTPPAPTPTPGAPLPTPPPGEFNHGDVNGDGVIDIRDVTMLRLYLVGRINQLGPAQ